MLLRHWILSLLLLSGPTVTSAASEPIEFDLAGRGEEETHEVERGKKFQLEILNLLPGVAYNVSVETRLPLIDSFSIDSFSFGGQSIASTRSMQEDLKRISRARSANLGCPSVSAFPQSARSKSNESEIRELVAVSRGNVGSNCEDKLEEVISDLTTRTIEALPEVRKEQEVVVTITRPGRSWILVLTPGGGEWRTSYGFTFVPNLDDRFITRPVEDQEGSC